MKGCPKIQFILFLFCNLFVSAQNETKIWYFGNHAGLDFNTSPPTILTNGALGYSNQEGSASIADAAGNLLFYTDGESIWDKTHNPMANGTGLLGHTSTTQSSLIIKKYNSGTVYYIFTLDLQGGANGICYSLVDISLAAGNGSVTLKNIPLFAPSEEKLTAVKHANGSDVWILTHDYNSSNFRAHLLTPSGISTTAVVSSVGTLHDGSIQTTQGCMKVSPDGKKVAVAVSGLHTLELYNFNDVTGILSNSVVLTNALLHVYGCEFSPDSKKLYAAGASDTILYQWDLCVNPNVQTAIQNYTITLGGMQLAPDGKIYISRFNKQVLGVINAPNKAGTACNFIELGQSIAPKIGVFTLPNFPNFYFYAGPALTINVLPNSTVCAGETITLSASGASTYTWNLSTIGSSIAVSPSITNTYSVIGTTTANCKFEQSIAVTVSPCTRIAEFENEHALKIFPNPFREKLSIDLTNFSAEFVRIKLFNTFGQSIYYKTIQTPYAEIDLSFLESGLYYLFVEGNSIKCFYKVRKE